MQPSCSPFRPDLNVCASNEGHMLCDTIDTQFENCMGALNCKMKTEMAVGSAGAEPIATFYQQMIPHHANAINMARVLSKTVDLSKEPFVEQLMNGPSYWQRIGSVLAACLLGVHVGSFAHSNLTLRLHPFCIHHHWADCTGDRHARAPRQDRCRPTGGCGMQRSECDLPRGWNGRSLRN